MMSNFELVSYDQRDKDRVIIFDSTLREGDQGMDGAFQLEEKIEIAGALEGVGVDVIEAGFPSSSQADFESTRAVAENTIFASVAALSLLNRQSIDRSWQAIEDARFPRLHVFIPTSTEHLNTMSSWQEGRVLEQIDSMVSYAKQTGAEVEFSPEDASRTGIDFLIRCAAAAALAGADVINVPDTVGYAKPAGWAQRVGHVRAAIDSLKVEALTSTHNHNDLGNAVANAVAAVEVGADQVEVTVNGVGERAGNANMEQVLANLHVHRREDGYSGIEHIDRSQVYELCRAVSRIMDEAISRYQPIVGVNAFQHQSGLHASKVLQNAETYEVLDPAEWGLGGSLISYGSHSGATQFKSLLESNGLEIGDDFASTVQAVKDLAHQRSRSFTEEEVIAMFK